MDSITEFIKMFKNPAMTIATLTTMIVGGFFGIMAFYNGWLG